jgi:hypothetical protein
MLTMRLGLTQLMTGTFFTPWLTAHVNAWSGLGQFNSVVVYVTVACHC